MVGQVAIGGDAPVLVQSMTKTDTRDVDATVVQIETLQRAGCEIVRLAIPDEEAAEALGEIKRQTSIPIVADIHFDYRLALQAIACGADKLRINPGNIGGHDRVERVVAAARERGIPMRIGVNAGSLEKSFLERFGGPGSLALVESALGHVALLEQLDFHDIVLSMKASDVLTTIEAYRQISARVDYPLHIGITEAGPVRVGSIRSAVGLGILLAEGIGDTLRVSLTGDPREEIRVGYEILQALHLRDHGPYLVSCPMCGRCEVDLEPIVAEIERRLEAVREPLTIAVMGCVVNGPGEARHADFGIAAGKGSGVLFRKGKIVRKVKESEIVEALLGEITSHP